MTGPAIVWTERPEPFQGQPTVVITGEVDGVRLHARYAPKAPRAAELVSAITQCITAALQEGWVVEICKGLGTNDVQLCTIGAYNTWCGCADHGYAIELVRRASLTIEEYSV